MQHLSCYVPDWVAKKVRRKAKEAQLPVSRYLVQLIEREVTNEWPDGYADLFGAWQGPPLERPAPEEFEKREG